MEVKRFGSPFFFNLLSMFFWLKESTTDSDSLKKAATQLLQPQYLCLGKSGSKSSQSAGEPSEIFPDGIFKIFDGPKVKRSITSINFICSL